MTSPGRKTALDKGRADFLTLSQPSAEKSADASAPLSKVFSVLAPRLEPMTTGPNTQTNKASELRGKARRRVRQFGRILLADGHSSIVCVILDVSEGGARVLVSAGAAEGGEIPETFRFFHDANHTIHDAQVVQRRAKTMGLRLLSTLDLGADQNGRN